MRLIAAAELALALRTGPGSHGLGEPVVQQRSIGVQSTGALVYGIRGFVSMELASAPRLGGDVVRHTSRYSRPQRPGSAARPEHVVLDPQANDDCAVSGSASGGVDLPINRAGRTAAQECLSLPLTVSPERLEQARIAVKL